MSTLNEIFEDIVDTPKEAITIAKKRAFLKTNFLKLTGKTPWTIERLDKASDSTINKQYNKLNNSTSKTPRYQIKFKNIFYQNFLLSIIFKI